MPLAGCQKGPWIDQGQPAEVLTPRTVVDIIRVGNAARGRGWGIGKGSDGHPQTQGDPHGARPTVACQQTMPVDFSVVVIGFGFRRSADGWHCTTHPLQHHHLKSRRKPGVATTNWLPNWLPKMQNGLRPKTYAIVFTNEPGGARTRDHLIKSMVL